MVCVWLFIIAHKEVNNARRRLRMYKDNVGLILEGGTYYLNKKKLAGNEMINSKR